MGVAVVDAYIRKKKGCEGGFKEGCFCCYCRRREDIMRGTF